MSPSVPAAVPAGEVAPEPIAILSVACRLPGGVRDPVGYWQLLEDGRDAVEAVPARWRTPDACDAAPSGAGTCDAPEGGFVHDVEGFDAAFFSISSREAIAIDPQQRLALESSWEALERAGIRPATLENTRTGVYLGATASDYPTRHHADLDDPGGDRGTGTAASMISGRISYVLGLAGPAITVDTACSSSLVALHLACAALRSGECDLALAGGVTVMTTPAGFAELGRRKALAMDGRCRSFAAGARGPGWSEGCCVLVLKRLAAAQRDRDPILALIRSSAVNQNGRSEGLTAPSGSSQVRVIRDALALARLAAGDIDAVEAHGIGAAVGDPIEAGALTAVFGVDRATVRPLYLGSAKSNLGHTQAAAGAAGVIKMVLALQHELLPRTLHATTPTPDVDWDASGLSLLNEARPWPRGARPRRAGVSSFGFSGTNAHLILEEAPAVPPVAEAAGGEQTLPLVLSGRDAAALRAQAALWAHWLETHPGARLRDVAHTAALRRTDLEHRASVIASSVGDAVAGLRALSAGAPHPFVLEAIAVPAQAVVFVYPGQGGQWSAMGRKLLAQSPPFARAAELCDTALRPFTGWSVRALLAGELELPLDRLDVMQPALFTMSVALTVAWRSVGLEPAAVVGHSQGEIAAAVVSGALTIQDAARLVGLRSKLLLSASGQGEMAIVERPVDEVLAFIEPYGSAISIAAVNTKRSTVVAGDKAAIAALLDVLDERDVFCGKLSAEVASHCAQMDPLLPELTRELASLRPRRTRIPFYSTVTGGLLEGELLDAAYWCKNLRNPVRLDRALEQLLARGHGVFVEVAPHPVLAMALTDGTSDQGGIVTGTLKRGNGDLADLLRTLAGLHVQGVKIDWSPTLGDGRLVDLPTYAFQRQRYWPRDPFQSTGPGFTGPPEPHDPTNNRARVP
jgi:acyl transferase domain-containing protein